MDMAGSCSASTSPAPSRFLLSQHVKMLHTVASGSRASSAMGPGGPRHDNKTGLRKQRPDGRAAGILRNETQHGGTAIYPAPSSIGLRDCVRSELLRSLLRTPARLRKSVKTG